ncbi:MAG TPA: glycoside hydrolase family 43 protein [Acidimicrobiales bacterium]|nr:glycoside hydrolase family 43 protein [Acidimicrobiales bacterium]
MYDGDFGDPAVVPTGASYVLFGTDDPPDHIPTATSSDLTTWLHGPDAVPVLPSWASPDPNDALTWAPAGATVGGRDLLYVSVHDAIADRQCIAVLAAHTPLGPYADARGSPLVCQAGLGGSIDPSVIDDDGLHLVWKSDGNCCGLPASLWEQDLRPDGLAVTGSAHRLLTADRAWQGGIVENPALLRASRGWWLFYSGNRFNVAAYGTGLAWCPSLAGPCRETASSPYLAGTATEFSPGGLDVFRDAGGRRWAAFATWNRPPRHGRFFCCRSLDLAPVVSS